MSQRIMAGNKCESFAALQCVQIERLELNLFTLGGSFADIHARDSDGYNIDFIFPGR